MDRRFFQLVNKDFIFQYNHEGLCRNLTIPHMQLLDFIRTIRNIVTSTISIYIYCENKELPPEVRVENYNKLYDVVLKILSEVKMDGEDYSIGIDHCRVEELMEMLGCNYNERIQSKIEENDSWLDYLIQDNIE